VSSITTNQSPELPPKLQNIPNLWDWHISDRDIDPSFSLAHYTKPETDWWNPITEEEATNPEQSHKDWVTSTETPDLEQLIQFDHGDETWINLHGRYSYREEKKGLISVLPNRFESCS